MKSRALDLVVLSQKVLKGREIRERKQRGEFKFILNSVSGYRNKISICDVCGGAVQNGICVNCGVKY